MVQTVFKYRLLLAAILLAAAGLRLFNLDYDLPEVYEEATPMIQALEMWASEDEPFDFNPHFFNYPSLYFYIQFLGQAIYYGANVLTGRFSSTHDMLAFHGQDPSELVLLARLITALFGVGAVWAVYLLGCRLSGPNTGLIAAAALAVLPTHVAASRTILVDTPLVFFVALALRGILQVLDSGRRTHALLSGLWIGLAASSKYTGALLVLPLVVVFALRIHRAGAKPWATPRLIDLWIGIGTAAFAFLVTSPYCLLDFKAFWADLSYERAHMTIGHFGTDSGSNLWPYAGVFWGNFGIWLGPFVLAGVVLLLLRLREQTRWQPLLAFCFFYTGVILTWSAQAGHYLLPVFPCLALFAAGSISALSRHLSRPTRQARSLMQVSLLLSLPIGIGTALDVTSYTERDPRTEAKAWVETHLAPGTIFAMEFHTPNLSEPTYTTVRIPMYVIQPDLSAPFYDLRWYADIDYIVTSSSVRHRYKSDPERFNRQASFYDSLEKEMTLVAEFPGSGTFGPTIKIFHNPRRASRSPDASIDSTLYSRLDQSSNLGDTNVPIFLRSLRDAFDQKGWYAKAADVGRWLIRLTPDPSIYDLDNLAHIALKQGDISGAIQSWKQAIQFDSTAASAYTNLGVAYARNGEFDRAVAVLEQGLDLASESSNLFINLARLYKLKGRFEDAETVFSRVIRLQPENVEAAIELAEIYRNQDRPEKAVEVLNAALRVAPDREEVRSQLEELLGK